MAEAERPLILKKKKVTDGGGHHGGAWKVAYADFVTAMMAFFLLMWLLNATSEDQRKGLADYFDPSLPISRNSAGGAGMLAGETVFSTERSAGSTTEGVRPRPTHRPPGETLGKQEASPDLPQGSSDRNGAAAGRPEGPDPLAADPGPATPFPTAPEAPVAPVEAVQEANARLDAAQRDLEAALEALDDPSQSEQVLVRMTPEGLVIELIDIDGQSLFESGSAEAGPRLSALIAAVAPVLETVGNPIKVVGHTDARPYGPDATYTNWELSADRANAARRLLESAGLNTRRISGVTGRAATAPLTADPLAPQNRRIAITLLRIPAN